MTGTELDPIQVIAVDIARADMHYVATSFLGLPHSAIAAEMALLQYGAMAAYEAQLHFGKTLGWNLDAAWDADTAKAARMSGKFFADKKRNLNGVVAHFDLLLRANRGAFFPSGRRGRLFDFLRDDLSVVFLEDRPYTSLVSAHYLTGLGPEQVSDLETVGPAIGDLSTGLGNIAGFLLHGSGIEFHEPGPMPAFQWFDGKSSIALPRLFGGELEPALASALLTVHSISSSAMMSSSRSLCPWCEAAARKHRFVALFQALTALADVREAGTAMVHSEEALAFLDEPESKWVLAQSKLRNGLIHLGLQDIAGSLGAGSTVDDAVRAYTGQDPEAVADRVAQHLTRFVEVLARWMLSPTPDRKTFVGALHPAP